MFTYVFVEVEDHEVMAFEIPERLFDLAREIEASSRNGPGVVLAIRREGTAKNSPISIAIVDEQECEELEIDSFVATLGNAPRRAD